MVAWLILSYRHIAVQTLALRPELRPGLAVALAALAGEATGPLGVGLLERAEVLAAHRAAAQTAVGRAVAAAAARALLLGHDVSFGAWRLQ
jgi:hypothetical protein